MMPPQERPQMMTKKLGRGGAYPAKTEEVSESTDWGDSFIKIRGIWYGKHEKIHTRCNTCEAHTDQIIYQNEDDEKYIYLCCCWTDPTWREIRGQ